MDRQSLVASLLARQRACHRETAASGDPERAWHRTFPATRDQVSAARRFLSSILGSTPLTADALACLGELANNSVIHSDSRLPGGTFTVRVQTGTGALRVEVRDNGGPWAPSRVIADSADPGISGRGLLIVAALAEEWGIAPTTTAPTRTAWFTLCAP